jgi:Tol biopolymer transport system component
MTIARAAVIMALAGMAHGSASAAPQTVTPTLTYVVSVARTPSYESLVEIVSATGHVRQVLSRRGHAEDARWAPGGSMVAWVDRSGLNVARSDGGDRRLLVHASRHCTRVCAPLTFGWSPDGRRLLVGGAGTQTNRLLVVTVGSGDVKNFLTPRPSVEYRILGWSPNGRWIAYSRDSGVPGTRTCCALGLFVSRPNGTRARRLVSFEEAIHDTPFGSWSPDSRSIAFTSDGAPHFAIVDVRSGRVRRVTSGEPLIEAPQWSADSKRLAVQLGWVVTLDTHGRNVRRLATAPGGAFLDWTGRGTLVIARGAQTSGVLVSRDGLSRARLAFRMPTHHVILSIYAR